MSFGETKNISKPTIKKKVGVTSPFRTIKRAVSFDKSITTIAGRKVPNSSVKRAITVGFGSTTKEKKSIKIHHSYSPIVELKKFKKTNEFIWK